MKLQNNTYTENETVIVVEDLCSNYKSDLFSESNRVLSEATKEVRSFIPSHQSAIAIVIHHKWSKAHTYISLSEKYLEWKGYAIKAAVYGIHRYILQCNETIRLTQAEFEAHLEKKGFGSEIGGHPPMRGWLAAPLRDLTGEPCGLIQLSDRIRGEYTKDDEMLLEDFVNKISHLTDRCIHIDR